MDAKELIVRFAAVMDTGDCAELDALLSAEFVLHSPLVDRTFSRDDVRNGILEIRDAFEEPRHQIEELIAEGNKVAVRFRIRGKQLRDYQGIVSRGKSFDITAMSIFRVEGGQIQEEWELVDRTGLVRQLGAGASPVLVRE